jgi:hypothetical protein
MNAINRVPTVNHVSTFPEGATHAGLTEVRSVIDFGRGCFETEASQMVVVSRSGSGYLMDAKHRVPTRHRVATGIEIVCLQVVFYEEVDGVLVQLKGKVHGMGIVGIANYISGAMELPVSNVVRIVAGVRFEGANRNRRSVEFHRYKRRKAGIHYNSLKPDEIPAVSFRYIGLKLAPG